MATMAKVDKGASFEARVARLLVNEGAFVRRRVLLEPHFGEKFAVTDLDLLAFDFSPALRLTTTIVECKAGEARNAPSGADRLLWLAGLRQLVHADRCALFVTKAAGDPLRRLAAELGSAIADERDVARREQLLGLKAGDRFGSHQLEIAGTTDSARAALKGDRELLRAYWFVRSELWLAPPATALKRALGATRLVGERYAPSLPENERLAIRWLAGELATGLALSVTRLAADSYQHPEAIFEARLAERLAEGVADYRALAEISKAVDEYLVGVLREARVSPGSIVQSLGAFAPRPPAYVDRLIELIHRFAASPRAAGDAARLSDAQFAAGLANAQTPWAAQDPDETGRLLRLLGAFVVRQTRVPEELVAPILESAPRLQGAAASDEPLNPRAPGEAGSSSPSTPQDETMRGPEGQLGDGPSTLFDRS
jgi:hypothetical protein